MAPGGAEPLATADALSGLGDGYNGATKLRHPTTGAGRSESVDLISLVMPIVISLKISLRTTFLLMASAGTSSAACGSLEEVEDDAPAPGVPGLANRDANGLLNRETEPVVEADAARTEGRGGSSGFPSWADCGARGSFGSYARMVFVGYRYALVEGMGGSASKPALEVSACKRAVNRFEDVGNVERKVMVSSSHAARRPESVTAVPLWLGTVVQNAMWSLTNSGPMTSCDDRFSAGSKSSACCNDSDEFRRNPKDRSRRQRASAE